MQLGAQGSVAWPSLHFRNGALRRCGEVKADVHDGPQAPRGAQMPATEVPELR